MSTKTPNYGLTLVEGTDLYNHLTNDNPNYTKIDSTMKTIEATGVPLANMTKSGNTFAITRTTKTNLFRFIAGAAYTAGSTFTVDGSAVTATLMNGEQLPSNAFRVNSNVLCALDGTKLTIYAQGDVDLSDYMPKTGGSFTGAITAPTVNATNTNTKSLGIDGNNVVDYQIARGTSGDWNYVKFASGRYICWSRVLVAGVLGNNSYAEPKFPVTFAAIPFVIATSSMTAVAANIGHITPCVRGLTTSGCTILCDYGKTSSWNTVDIFVVGRV